MGREQRRAYIPATRLLTEKQVERAEGLTTMAADHEATLVACALMNSKARARALSELRDEDFGVDVCQAVFAAIRKVDERNQRVTRLAVEDVLRQSEDTPTGAFSFLVECLEGVAKLSDAPYALEAIKEASLRRTLLRVCREGASAVIDLECKDPKGALFEMLLGVNDHETSNHLRHIKDVIEAQVREVQQAHADAKAGKPAALGSGFEEIDDVMAFLPGCLIVVAGRPAMGKSALAWNFATHMSQSKPVLVVTLEMTGEELAARQIQADLQMTTLAQARGDIRDEAWDPLWGFSNTWAAHKLYIDDSPSATIASVRASAQRVMAMTGEQMGAVYIDYLGLLDGEGENDTVKFGAMAREAKQLAKFLRCPVFLVCQLSRKCEDRPNKRPMMTDLRSSGEIEQHANIVLAVYRDDYYNPETTEIGIAEILVLKNRGAASGFPVKLRWLSTETRFCSPNAQRQPSFYSWSK